MGKTVALCPKMQLDNLIEGNDKLIEIAAL